MQQAVSTGHTGAMGAQRGALGRQGSKLRARSKRMDSALPDREAAIMSEDEAHKDDDYLYQQNTFAAPAGPGIDFDTLLAQNPGRGNPVPEASLKRGLFGRAPSGLGSFIGGGPGTARQGRNRRLEHKFSMLSNTNSIAPAFGNRP